MAAYVARAALESVLLAREKGCESVMVEGDNSQIVAAIQEAKEVRFRVYGALLREILILARSFSCFSCSFVRRPGNKLAHALAHLSLSSSIFLKTLFFRPI